MLVLLSINAQHKLVGKKDKSQDSVVKEKTIAAKRSGAGCLIFPAANQKDFEELPEYLREWKTTTRLCNPHLQDMPAV